MNEFNKKVSSDRGRGMPSEIAPAEGRPAREPFLTEGQVDDFVCWSLSRYKRISYAGIFESPGNKCSQSDDTGTSS